MGPVDMAGTSGAGIAIGRGRLAVAGSVGYEECPLGGYAC